MDATKLYRLNKRSKICSKPRGTVLRKRNQDSRELLVQVNVNNIIQDFRP